MAKILTVGPAEGGQKLLRYLEHALACSRPELYRLLRTGQIRVNGGRVKPERIIQQGDEVRLPPQAEILGGIASAQGLSAMTVAQESLGSDLELIYQNDEILVLNKPSGLPVQGGSGHSDSVAARLKLACLVGFYNPAPAHRLDLHASGLLLCGKTHAAQSHLHSFFREAKPTLERGYLCWVKGNALVQLPERRLLENFLLEECSASGHERMAVVSTGGKEARAWYSCLAVLEDHKLGAVSLVQAWLLTGRKHQIRVQLAAQDLPLLGDGRYGGPTGFSLMLHAWHITLPCENEKLNFKCLPNWQGRFAVPANIPKF